MDIVVDEVDQMKQYHMLSSANATFEMQFHKIDGTVKPVYNDDIMGYFSASKGHLDGLQKAEFVNTSKLVPSAIIKTHTCINHR